MLQRLLFVLIVFSTNFSLFILLERYIPIDDRSMILGVIATGIAGTIWFYFDTWLHNVSDYEEFSLPDGGTVLIETSRPKYEIIKEILGRAAAKHPQHELFLKAAQQALKTAEMIMETVRAIPDSPDGSEIKFGLKASSEGSFAIAKLGGEINYTVTLTWNKKEQARLPNPELIPHDRQTTNTVN